MVVVVCVWWWWWCVCVVVVCVCVVVVVCGVGGVGGGGGGGGSARACVPARIPEACRALPCQARRCTFWSRPFLRLAPACWLALARGCPGLPLPPGAGTNCPSLPLPLPLPSGHHAHSGQENALWLVLRRGQQAQVIFFSKRKKAIWAAAAAARVRAPCSSSSNSSIGVGGRRPPRAALGRPCVCAPWKDYALLGCVSRLRCAARVQGCSSDPRSAPAAVHQHTCLTRRQHTCLTSPLRYPNRRQHFWR